MTNTQRIMDWLTDQSVDALIHLLAELFEDFAEVRGQYEQAVQTLKEELGEEPVNAEADAIRQQVESNLLFSGILGIKANLDNFINPIARNFLDADSEVYLREAAAHSLPVYEIAQKARNRFCASLTVRQREIYDAVAAYSCYLETAGPKLAHYYGYLLGDELLPRVIPGYYSDPVLTTRYKMMLGGCFGRKIPE